MKLIILLITCCLLSSSLLAQEDYHVTVTLMEEVDGTIEYAGSSVGFRLTDHKNISDKFWWKPGRRGSSRRPDYDKVDSASEIGFDLTLYESNNRFYIIGDVSKWTLSPPEPFFTGVRIDVDETMPLDSGIIIDCGEGWKGVHYYLQLEVSRKKKSGEGIDWAKNEIYVETEGSYAGQVLSKGRNGRAKMISEQSFPSEFGTPFGVKPSKRVYMEVKVSGPDLGSIVSYPFEIEILIERTYRIDLNAVPHEKTIDVTYRSENRHKIELIKGKQYMIHLPPDTPSVEGFDISTKLHLTPGLY